AVLGRGQIAVWVGLLTLVPLALLMLSAAGPGHDSRPRRGRYPVANPSTTRYSASRYTSLGNWHADQQGPRRGLVDAAGACHPGGGRQLRLRHPEARPRALRGPAAVDRRDAVPGAAPARAPRPHRGALGGPGQRPAAQVLPHHAERPEAARGGAPAMAGGGRDAPGHLV